MRKNQSGFSVVELLLVIAVVVVVGGAGFWVYHSHVKSSTVSHSNNTSGNNSNTSKGGSGNTTGTTHQTTSYFSIPEWKVQAPYSGSAGFTYSLMSNNANSAWINSQQLASADPACKISADSGNVGYIGRYLPSDNVSTGQTPETAQQYLSQDFAASNSAAPHYSKVSGYYYIYWQVQGPCTSNPILATVRNEIGNIVDHFQLIAQ